MAGAWLSAGRAGRRGRRRGERGRRLLRRLLRIRLLERVDEEPGEGASVGAHHALARDLVTHPGNELHLDRDLHLLERLTDLERLRRDAVVLAGEEIDPLDLALVLAEPLAHVAPVGVARAEDQPA